MTEVFDIETMQKVAGGGLIVLIVRWALAQIGGAWRRSSADTAQIEAQTDALVATGWREMVADLRREIADERARCDEQLAALSAELHRQGHQLDACRRLIVAWATGRTLTTPERKLMQQIAPDFAYPPKEPRR